MRVQIVIPHKHGPMNDECLCLSLRMLREGIRELDKDYIITVDDGPDDPYAIWNRVAAESIADIIVMTNTDVLMAPGWDTLVAHCRPNAIVTGYLVECGAIGVHPVNIEKDFGRKPSMFKRVAFEEYVVERAAGVPLITEERGWYMPCAMDRRWFVGTGGFDVSLGGFQAHRPLDIYFWDKCARQPGFQFLRARSFAYHFQNLSDERRVRRE